jgi:hypothetical protein
MKVKVLGERYEVIESNCAEDLTLAGASDGYCDHTTKSIVIDTFKPSDDSLGDLERYRKQVIRHELVHAFLFESGLGANSWGSNEEIVDWIAAMFPKMLEAFEEVDAI